MLKNLNREWEKVKLGRYGWMAKNHIRGHRPKMYRNLEKQGKLERVLQDMERRLLTALEVTEERLLKADPPPKTDSYMAHLKHLKRIQNTAWELCRDIILLPDEETKPRL
jgi:hypothetical protein